MSQKKTILYVEDDLDDREIFSETISKIANNVTVEFAGNGLEALSYINTGVKPCLIILDLNLPFLDGKETFRRLRGLSDLDNVPVIIFTSSERQNDKQFFRNYGVEYFSKPTDMKDMLFIANRMISVCTSR